MQAVGGLSACQPGRQAGHRAGGKTHRATTRPDQQVTPGQALGEQGEPATFQDLILDVPKPPGLTACFRAIRASPAGGGKQCEVSAQAALLGSTYWYVCPPAEMRRPLSCCPCPRASCIRAQLRDARLKTGAQGCEGGGPPLTLFQLGVGEDLLGGLVLGEGRGCAEQQGQEAHGDLAAHGAAAAGTGVWPGGEVPVGRQPLSRWGGVGRWGGNE